MFTTVPQTTDVIPQSSTDTKSKHRSDSLLPRDPKTHNHLMKCRPHRSLALKIFIIDISY